jgi:ketopantoate reductase
MGILVVGAIAIGSYFGGRLIEAKRDVTFLSVLGRLSLVDPIRAIPVG